MPLSGAAAAACLSLRPPSTALPCPLRRRVGAAAVCLSISLPCRSDACLPSPCPPPPPFPVGPGADGAAAGAWFVRIMLLTLWIFIRSARPGAGACVGRQPRGGREGALWARGAGRCAAQGEARCGRGRVGACGQCAGRDEMRRGRRQSKGKQAGGDALQQCRACPRALLTHCPPPALLPPLQAWCRGGCAHVCWTGGGWAWGASWSLIWI